MFYIVQVLCNGGMATELSLLYLLDIGSADLAVDFKNEYRSSWLGMAILGSLACCNGDTWASELGTVFAKSQPWLITTLQPVPRVGKDYAREMNVGRRLMVTFARAPTAE